MNDKDLNWEKNITIYEQNIELENRELMFSLYKTY